METIDPTKQQKPKTQIVFILLAGVLLAAIVLVAVLFSYESTHAQTIYPGVSLEGVDLSGLTVDQAVVKINEGMAYPTQGKLLFTDGDAQWLYTPQELGFSLNPYTSAEVAFLVGRGEGFAKNLIIQSTASQQGIQLEPTVIYDQRQAYAVLQGIARQIDQPMIEASVGVNGTEVVAVAGQVGRQVDITASLEVLEALLFEHKDGLVPLVIKETEPVIMDVKVAADLAQQVLSAPLVLKMPNESSNLGPWKIEISDLAKLLVIERKTDSENAEYQVSLNQTALLNYLTGLAPALRTEPVNPRFIFNDDTRQLEVIRPAVIGRALDVEASVEAITTKLPAGEHEIALVLKPVDPAVKDDTTGESLGITELVVAETSYFYGSDPARIQNISAAASSFHGLLIPPGATFSMASELTDISLENGYAEALIIVGKETVKGVGGGVCQVSTTLFRTAFFGGFPIVERHAHAYRVSYYEQQSNGWVDTNLAGLDATVYVPLVDFKFTNDTPNWLLMETYVEGYSLTWKFYSAKDGRSMDWTTTGVTNVQAPPEPLYRENPDLPAGTIKQVDWAVEGASVEVNRIVYKDGGVYFTDTFRTDYIPWQAIYEYGPGTEIPE
ncbi:MAG: VanW family protein [Anaerolineaceae bacterium]